MSGLTSHKVLTSRWSTLTSYLLQKWTLIHLTGNDSAPLWAAQAFSSLSDRIRCHSDGFFRGRCVKCKPRAAVGEDGCQFSITEKTHFKPIPVAARVLLPLQKPFCCFPSNERIILSAEMHDTWGGTQQHRPERPHSHLFAVFSVSFWRLQITRPAVVTCPVALCCCWMNLFTGCNGARPQISQLVLIFDLEDMLRINLVRLVAGQPFPESNRQNGFCSVGSLFPAGINRFSEKRTTVQLCRLFTFDSLLADEIKEDMICIPRSTRLSSKI